MRLRTPADFGAAIRQKRRALGIDQGTLAKRVGVSRQWLVGVEKGKSRAAIGLVLRALTTLGIAIRAGEETSAAPRRGLPGATVDLGRVLDLHRGPRGKKNS